MHCLSDAHRAVEGTGDAHHHCDGTTGELVGLGELVADDRELVQGGLQHLLLQHGMAGQHDAEHGGQQKQPRKGRQDGVIGDQRREVAALIVGVLVDHRDDKTHDTAPLLHAIQPAHHDAIGGDTASALLIPRVGAG